MSYYSASEIAKALSISTVRRNYMESILTSIKKLLTISEECDHFDSTIIMLVNSVFALLFQLGVGSANVFRIADASSVWSDFLNDDPRLEFVKTYIYLKVKLVFDSSSLSNAVIESINRQISELEWRINTAVESD